MDLSYLIADAKELPFKSESLDAAFSIYFTDIIPFRYLIEEVSRVLKNGGFFVHFGPLDYHFDNIADCLTSEEIKLLLLLEGYEILYENFVTIQHLTTSSMVKKNYDNWVLVAQKRQGSKISSHSILVMTHPIDFYVHKEVFNGKERLKKIRLRLNDYDQESQEFVVELLKLVNGSRSIGQILDELNKTFSINMNLHEHVYAIILKLMALGLVSLKETITDN